MSVLDPLSMPFSARTRASGFEVEVKYIQNGLRLARNSIDVRKLVQNNLLFWNSVNNNNKTNNNNNKALDSINHIFLHRKLFLDGMLEIFGSFSVLAHK